MKWDYEVIPVRYWLSPVFLTMLKDSSRERLSLSRKDSRIRMMEKATSAV